MPPPHPPAAGRLGGTSVILLGLAVTVPLGVARGALARPLLVVVVGLLLLTFAAGHGAMARRMPRPGPLYGLIARGLGRPLGLGAAALALLSYTALQLSLYGAIGAAAAPLLETSLGITVAWWAVALCCWAVVAGCGVLPLPVTGRLVKVLVSAEIAAIVWYGVAPRRFSWAALSPASLADMPRPALGLLLVLGALTFVGFETTGVHGGRVRPWATYLCIGLIAVLLTPASLATVSAGGTADAGGAAPAFDPDAVALGRVALVGGLLAAIIALHEVIARHLLVLGRERVLPGALGRRTAASLAQTVVAGAVLGGCAYAGAGIGRGPGVAGGLGILLLLPVTSLAALLFLNRNPDGEGVWRRFLAPALSTVALGVLGVLAARDLPALLGVPVERAWIAPAVAGTAVLLGAGYGPVLRRRSPVVYAGIGLGGAAVVVTPVRPVIPRQRVPGAHRPERVGGEEPGAVFSAGPRRRRTP